MALLTASSVSGSGAGGVVTAAAACSTTVLGAVAGAAGSAVAAGSFLEVMAVALSYADSNSAVCAESKVLVVSI
jgi:hypothetical protein